MTKDTVIYSVNLSFQDIMDVDAELQEQFDKLSEDEQSKFIARNKTFINNGLSSGTDYSTVMRVVADMLTEDLIKLN